MNYYDPSKSILFLLHPNPFPLYIVHPFFILYLTAMFIRNTLLWKTHRIALQQANWTFLNNIIKLKLRYNTNIDLYIPKKMLLRDLFKMFLVFVCPLKLMWTPIHPTFNGWSIGCDRVATVCNNKKNWLLYHLRIFQKFRKIMKMLTDRPTQIFKLKWC